MTTLYRQPGTLKFTPDKPSATGRGRPVMYSLAEITIGPPRPKSKYKIEMSPEEWSEQGCPDVLSIIPGSLEDAEPAAPEDPGTFVRPPATIQDVLDGR